MPTTNINLAWDANYHLKEADKAEKLVLLLHGFQQTGEEILNMLGRDLPRNATILAPDAPFPLPQKQASGYRPAFTWYFFDPQTEHYLHDMSLACRYLEALVNQLNLHGLPTCIVGFSQGGYLAPHVGERLEHTQQVIGINCRFRSEALTGDLPFLLDAVNGENDLIVDHGRARSCHDDLMARGCRGIFELIPGAGHGLSGGIRNKMKQLLFRKEA